MDQPRLPQGGAVGRLQNGNEEIAYNMLWSGRAYSDEEAREARAAKERYLKAA